MDLTLAILYLQNYFFLFFFLALLFLEPMFSSASMLFWVTHIYPLVIILLKLSRDIALSIKLIKFFYDKSFKTFLKHTAKDYHNQSVNPPVVRASTIIFKSMQDIRKTQA